MKKTFYDEKIQLTLDKFVNFDFQKCVSWSQVELWSAVNGIEIASDIVDVFLTGTRVFQNVFDVFITCIRETGFLDQYINNIGFIENIFKIYKISKNYELPADVHDFITWLYNNELYSDITVDFTFNKDVVVRNKYSLLQAIDSKYPYLLVQFYDKRKRDLHRFDDDFVRWLLKLYESKIDKGSIFKQIYTALSTDIKRENQTAMFMH